MTFEECCMECIGNKEFVKQFNRLTGHKIGNKRTPIETMIDEACGYDQDKEGFPDFIKFVYDYIWIPLVENH